MHKTAQLSTDVWNSTSRCKTAVYKAGGNAEIGLVDGSPEVWVVVIAGVVAVHQLHYCVKATAGN